MTEQFFASEKEAKRLFPKETARIIFLPLKVAPVAWYVNSNCDLQSLFC